jgi:lysyl-tRNA synthetase class 2
VVRLGRRRIDYLRQRGRALGAVRAFFSARDFVEIEPPLLVRAPGLEVQLVAIPAEGGWLITSPEYQMKRLLAGGFERIFALCRCFRGEEEGAQHSSEFTMLEWYRSWADLDDVLADTESLVAEVARAVTGTTRVTRAGRTIELSPPWPRWTVAQALQRCAGIELSGDESVEALAALLTRAGIDARGARTWDDLFYTAFVERVDPVLAALDHPLFLTDWPLPLSALARRKGEEPVVERFEAYAGGLELANAFGELTDPVEQRARFCADQAERRQRGRPVYPLDERLLAALQEGIPPSAGIALGVDRLVMLVTGAEHITLVQAFSQSEL